MQKAKAIMATGQNIKAITKIPNYVQTKLEEFKQEFNDLKAAVD